MRDKCELVADLGEETIETASIYADVLLKEVVLVEALAADVPTRRYRPEGSPHDLP